MKITTTGPRPAAVTRRRAAGDSDGGVRGAGFSVDVGGRPAAAGGAASPGAPLTSLAALIAVQEVTEAGDGRRRRAARRGHDLLDRLDELRLALVEGRLAEPALRRLAALLGDRAEPADDPRLAAILGEIELRAAVELAKLERG